MDCLSTEGQRILRSVKLAGLDIQCKKSVQGDEVYARVTATVGRIRKHADLVNFRVKLSESVLAERARDIEINDDTNGVIL